MKETEKERNERLCREYEKQNRKKCFEKQEAMYEVVHQLEDWGFKDIAYSLRIKADNLRTWI